MKAFGYYREDYKDIELDNIKRAAKSLKIKLAGSTSEHSKSLCKKGLPEVINFSMAPGDILLLGCNGITFNMDAADYARFLIAVKDKGVFVVCADLPMTSNELPQVMNLPHEDREQALGFLTNLTMECFGRQIKSGERKRVYVDKPTPEYEPEPPQIYLSPKDKCTYVYVMKASDNLVKIGMSAKPEFRLSTLQDKVSGKYKLSLAGVFHFEKITAKAAETMALAYFNSRNANLKGFQGATEFFSINAKEVCDFLTAAGGKDCLQQ